MSEEMVVRQAAPTLAGIKTGSLFPCPCMEKETLLEEIRAFNRRYLSRGLCLLPLRFTEGKALFGLFLSYPPEDVKGFIENRAANAKCTGVWKVYGDEQQAQQTFDRYKKCTQTYCERWRSGVKLDRLAVADRIERKS